MFDIFFSYPHQCASETAAISAELRARGLKVWIDDSEIADYASISRSITEGLAGAKALLVYYAAQYARSRPCQWELTAAFLAASREGDPRRRVLVINPEAGAEHIHPVELRDALFQAAPGSGDRDAIERLAASVHAHVTTLSTTLGEIEPLTPPPWYGIRVTGSSRFVGRLPDLWRIHSALHAGQLSLITATAGPALALVQGMGGVGKSLLAAEYAVRFAAACEGGVFWLRAFGHDDAKVELSDEEREAERSRQIRDFAMGLDLPVQGRTLEEIEGHLARELGARGRPFLWVVDDIPSGLKRETLLRWLAPHPLGKTLLTTRSREYDPLGIPVPLGTLTLDEAYQLLTRPPDRREPDGEAEEAAARAIVERLGCHALAVDVAGAALRLQSFGYFLAALDDLTRDELELAKDLAGMLPSGHEPGIAATLSRSLTHLGSEGWDFLRLAAIVAVAPIPATMVQAVFEAVDDADAGAGRARALKGMHHAEQLSLADRPQIDSTVLSVHTLVSRTVRFRDPEPARRDAVRAAAISALTRDLAAKAHEPHHPLEIELLFTHARELVRTLDDLSGADLLRMIALYDHARGAYGSAERHWRSLYELRRRLVGEMNVDTLTVMNNLAETLRVAADLPAARELQERVLEGYRQLLGNDHRDTITAMNNLALTVRAQGNLPQARALLEQVLECFRRLLGDGDPDTLTAMNNLAETLRSQGDMAAARALLERTVEASRGVLSETHPGTLRSMGNLALTLLSQGDLPGARALQERVLEENRRALGETHPDTLRAMVNLASTLSAQGDLSGARMLEEQALEGSRQLLGEAHPDTLLMMNNLAATLRGQGDLPGARAFLERVLDSSRRLLGDTHADTSASAWNLFILLVQMEDHAAARMIFKRDLNWLLDPNWLLDQTPESLGANRQAILAEIYKLYQPVSGWSRLKRWLRRWSPKR